MAKPVEKPVELSRAAALWTEAMSKRDAAAAAQLIKENPHETARGLLADPEVWRRWEDVARRALVPTENCASQLFVAWPLIKQVEEDLLVFGNADPVVFALYERVAELNANLRRYSRTCVRRPTAGWISWARISPWRSFRTTASAGAALSFSV